MRLQRLGFELGMELAAEIPGMAGQFADFDVNSVRSFTGEPQAVLLEHRFVFAIELVAMTVPFTDLARSIGRPGEAVLGQQAGVRAQAHGAAQLIDALQLTQFVDDAIGRGGIELG